MLAKEDSLGEKSQQTLDYKFAGLNYYSVITIEFVVVSIISSLRAEYGPAWLDNLNRNCANE